MSPLILFDAIALAHVRSTVEADPRIVQWHFGVDNLATHQSASLVRYVAEESDLVIDLGVKGQSGLLVALETRAAFLSDHGPTASSFTTSQARVLDEPG